MTRRFHYEFVAIILSAAIHGAPLITLITGSSNTVPANTEPTPLTLSMFKAPPAPVEPIIEKPPEPEQKPPPKVVEKPKPEPKPEPEPVTEPPPPEPEPEPAQEVAEPAPPVEPPPMITTSPKITEKAYRDPGLIAQIEQQYKYELSRLIDAHKKYPKRAQRRNQQGKATVRFVLMRNGEVKQVELLDSSGYPVLDKAAMRAIEAVSGKLPLPDEINRNSWRLEVPLTFELT